jgi:hypothetical protein
MFSGNQRKNRTPRNAARNNVQPFNEIFMYNIVEVIGDLAIFFILRESLRGEWSEDLRWVVATPTKHVFVRSFS